jgi:hypothetical protein
MDELLGNLAKETNALEVGARELAPRMLVALLMGALLATRPWRRKVRPSVEIQQTGLLMCVAAALVASVIGDSLARAFGVVGLGGFIRFRSNFKDPRDSALLFVLIGVGMAAGMGLLELAVVGAVLVGLILAGLEALVKPGKRRSERVRLVFDADDPGRATAAFLAALGDDGYEVLAASSGPGRRTALEVEGPGVPVEGWDKATAKVGRLLSWERAGGAVIAEGGQAA